VGQLGKSSI